MKKATWYYLVEKTETDKGLIYKIYKDENGLFCFLIQNFLDQFEHHLCIGQVIKENKRGLTFISRYIGIKPLNIFIDRSFFLNVEEKYINKYKRNL